MDIDLLSNIFYAMVRCGTPLLLVALGELICEKSGVLNLGQEGMMLFFLLASDVLILYRPRLNLRWARRAPATAVHAGAL